MLEVFIKAKKECTKRRDVKPDKVLRPIGTTFKEWIEPETSTDLPHWIHWKVVRHIQSFRGRSGDTLLYERHEEIQGIKGK